MMKRFTRLGLIATVCAATVAACADARQSETDTRPWDVIAATDGLSAAEASLAARDQTAEIAFVRGGLHFLMAFEHVLQVRYNNSSVPIEVIPGFDYRIETDPTGTFDPAFLETALSGALDHMAAAQDVLTPAISETFTADVPIESLWFDIDGDGSRSDWESLSRHMGVLMNLPVSTNENDEFIGFEGTDVTIQFDTADADWLAAYTHAISGVNELILSLDPTPAITEVFEGRAQLNALPATINDIGFIDEDQLDVLAAAILMMDGVPDKSRTQKALSHFQATIEHNRAFWREVESETDNEREWLPNENQESVFGVTVSAETAEAWQAVLYEMDLILKGEHLLPFFRLNQGFGQTEGYGVNLASLLNEPGDFNLVLMLQGATFAPHIEQGPFADRDALREFSSTVPGSSILFAAWLN
ncbi:MAG: hypothetical protein AAGJ29_11115 [Pseudomonadota bacterium]